jgi:hypothetical protein
MHGSSWQKRDYREGMRETGEIMAGISVHTRIGHRFTPHA